MYLDNNEHFYSNIFNVTNSHKAQFPSGSMQFHKALTKLK